MCQDINIFTKAGSKRKISIIVFLKIRTIGKIKLKCSHILKKNTPLHISWVNSDIKTEKKYILEMNKSDKNYINNKSQNTWPKRYIQNRKLLAITTFIIK